MCASVFVHVGLGGEGLATLVTWEPLLQMVPIVRLHEGVGGEHFVAAFVQAGNGLGLVDRYQVKAQRVVIYEGLKAEFTRVLYLRGRPVHTAYVVHV